jgi:hypothetical protein
MLHDTNYWHGEYEAYMASLAADCDEPATSANEREIHHQRFRPLTREEFRTMWERVLQDDELADEWVRRLTNGYEKEKELTLAMLDEAFPAFAACTAADRQPRTEPIAA